VSDENRLPPPSESSAPSPDPIQRSEAPASASSPTAGAAKQPLYQRPWFIVVAALVVLGILIGGEDDDGDAATVGAPAATTAPAPEATPTPTPQPTPEPEPEPKPVTTFGAIVIEGRGDDIIDVPVITDAPVVATFTHSGSSNFAVVSFGGSGERLDLLVNEIGNYRGTVPLNFSSPPAELEITADGAWTVTISDVRDQPVYDGAASGSGDQVLLVTVDAGRLAATHDGRSNFAVLAWGDRRTLMINEIGAYTGTVRLPDAIALEISADGNWTLESR
jgi:hypothetical protein